MKKLLNIDGGGVRVYFPLLILNYIEKKTGRKILDMFDFFAGVSASSIILSCLLTKYSVEEIIKIFKDFSNKIFYKSYFYTLKSGFGLFDAKYPESTINNEFQKIFGDYKLSDVKKPLIILTYDINNYKPITFHTYKDNNDYPLWQVIRGSTSAPTYFTPFNFESHVLVDGGVVANNLSELVFTHALNHFGFSNKFFQLSIGTGYHNPKMNPPPKGMWGWALPIFDVLFNASSVYEMSILRKISKFDHLEHFYRIDIELNENIGLDDYTAFDKMDKIFDKWFKDNVDYLDSICEELEKVN
jgi:patatin-like phospholipase/acyl hydrolase